MFIKEICPNVALTGFIRKYQVIRWQYEPNCLPVDKFLAPGPEHSLTFYLRDTQSYRFIEVSILIICN